ncbi:hypothetical protein PILCRDRAFT_13734 [Piloderma croceum F 1598]|uniref:C2 domain-containing protein n=1 Tax=Piloderma croceum (strain F 1598) TaxID=765440 RepID=A0A0C3ERX9_PILCF|nr:hypothetical protein PILCRDRAFT_13734 [Piloderma croceum F 1598]
MALLHSNLSPSTSPKILRDDAYQERPVDSCRFLLTMVGETGLCGSTAWSQGQGGYVTVTISSRQIHKTAVVGNAGEPEWNDTFQFTTKHSDNLIISVYASNVSGHDILLGLVEESLVNVDCTGNGDMSRKVFETQGNRSFALNFRFEHAMFGLFIAINEYEIQAIPNLRGCKTDAQSVMEILAHRFHVPSANFLFLADEQATRSAIISRFQKHLIENSNIQHGDAIVVFYAGHGSQTDAPSGWIVDNGKVETICPHDE